MRIFFPILFLLLSFSTTCQEYFLFIGTYSGTGSKGIYVYKFDDSTGKLTWVNNTDKSVVSPSFLTIAPTGKFVYACTEARIKNAGSVSAFAFNKKSGSLKFINKQPSGGDNPVYLSVNHNNTWLVNANYFGGNLSAFPINADGSLQPFSQLIQHTGKSINPERQEAAHVHSTVFSPAQDYLLVPDLGIDKIMIYRFDETQQSPLTTTQPAFTNTTSGSGPRHLAFHPNGRFAYLIEELSGTVSVYNYHKGTLDSTQRISTHTDDASGPFGSADIHLSPDGRFLYVSNRGKENNITLFSIDDLTGKLNLVGYESTRGEVPRNFTISPSGNFLLVANEKTGNVIVFKRNKKNGKLEYAGIEISIPQPSCLQFLKN
ncbi:MAG: lactonase family protein [Chitinophagales bacterium]|nr:lactonase family protein [Chitinophagales bacterium]